MWRQDDDRERLWRLGRSGVSLHQEFDLLEQTGLTPLMILQMTTWNGGEFLERESIMGTVDEDKDANLVLLNGNPWKALKI